MYSVSSSFKSAIMSTSRILKAKVVINSNTYDETYISDMSFEDTSNPSDSFEIGSVASAILTLSLINVNEVFETATIKPYIGLDLGGTVEYVPLGVFYVDDVDRKKNVVTLTCYDGMIKLEKAYFSNLTYPATITAVMNEICSKAGIQFTGTLPNYSISKKPEGYTYREVAAFIAQMCGGFAKFDRDGKLRIKSYASISETITADSYVDFSKAKDQAFRIDKVTCQVDDKTISKGTLSAGGSEVTFENPFMTDAILTDVYNKLKGFQFTPIDLQYVGNPAYDVGDIVSLVTIDNETYSIPIMSHKLSYSGGLTGEIQSIGETENSNQFDSSGSISKTVDRVVYEQALINEALINKATIEDLEATNARIDDLVTNDLTAINAAIQNLQADKADITDLNAANARIDNLDATKADIDDLDATNARIDNLEATKASITDLDAVNAAIQNLQADKANITDLNATNARIDNLVANDLTAINAAITNLQAEKADITDLNAVNATIATLQADVGSINTLLAGNLGAENFQAGAIYAGSGVIAQGAIGDAEISNLNASKINAGILNTALVTIQGANGRLKMANNRLQVFANKTDGTLYERVSLGDVNGDGSVYGLRVRGADGQTVLFDENGVKREGITDGSITDDKIADDANISGTKLDIASVVTEINEGTTTIQSSKIFYDGKTLDIQLGTMVDTVTAQGQTITNHETRITATEQGLLTKVSVTEYQQDQSALSTQLSQMNTQIQEQANQIALKAEASNVYTKSQIDGQFTTVNTQISNLSAQLTVQADQIATKVSKTEFDALQIGGRNLLTGTDETTDLTSSASTKREFYRTPYDLAPIFDKLGLIEYTLSFDLRVETEGNIRVYSQNGSGSRYNFSKNVYATTDWQRFSVTFIPSGPNENFTESYLAFYGTYGTGVIPHVRKVKLELGNRATDWTPAPEDVQGQIDGLGSRMTTAETSITQLSNQIALKANQSTVDTLTGQVNSLSAQLTVQADQIATKVEKDGVISAINQTAESVKIQASKVDIDGDLTVVNGLVRIKDAVIKDAMIKSVDAGKITTGTLDAAKVSVINLNASNITSGKLSAIDIEGVTITGSTLISTVLMDDGYGNQYDRTIIIDEGQFNSNDNYSNLRKLSIYDGTFHHSYYDTQEDETLFVDLDAATLRFSKFDKIELFSIGYVYVDTNRLGLGPRWALEGTGDISIGSSYMGKLYVISDIDMLNNNLNNVNHITIADPGSREGIEWLGGNGWRIVESPDDMSNAAGNLQIAKGSTRAFTVTTGLNVYFGGTSIFNGGDFLEIKNPAHGARILLTSDSTSAFLLSEVAYTRTYSGTANMYVTSNGVIGRITSAMRYKEDIQEVPLESGYAERILQLKPKSWYDKTEISENGGSTVGLDRRYGLIAEDVVAAGLPEYAIFTPPDENGNREVDGIAYDRLWTLLIPVTKGIKEDLATTVDRVAWLETENDYLKQRVTYLENKLNELEAKIA